LKLKYKKTLSNFSFNFDLRHYILEMSNALKTALPDTSKVGWCSLTPG
jgi:hypothetical protein